MPTIALHKDPSNIKKVDFSVVHSGSNVLEWMYKNIDLSVMGCSVLLNGNQIADIDSMSTDEFLCAINFSVGNGDAVKIVMRPRGTDPITTTIASIFAVQEIFSSFVPTPRLPNGSEASGQSPNNQLNAATNTFRPRQAIPDIAGQVVSYPDFIQPSYYEYIDNLKVIKEIFCIGEGRYTVDQVKSGETLLDDIPGSSYIVHDPGSSPSELLNVRGTNEVDGQELLSADGPSRVGTVSSGRLIANDVIGNTSAGTDANLKVGDTFDVDIDYTPLGGGPTENLSGEYTVQSVDETTINVEETDIPSSDIGTANGTVTNTSSTGYDQWFVLEGDSIEEVWFQIQAPQGIKSDNNDTLVIDINLEVEELDSDGLPTGTVTTKAVEIIGNTLESQFRTFKVTSSDGLTVPNRFRARAQRQTSKEPSPGVDLIKLEDIQSVTPYSGASFGDVTLLEVDRKATTFAISQRQSKINALVTRKLELFDPLTGDFDSGVFTETRSFADYVFYILRQQVGVAASKIDTEALFGIYDNLSDPQLGYFDFTFDDVDTGLRERVEIACNVARVRYYNLPTPTWNFVREEANQTRAAMFNRRNILSGNSAQVFRFQRTADFDSVSIQYVDPDDNVEAIISRKWDGAAIVSGEGLRVNEIKLAGCRNSTQATNRAELEIRKLIYNRRTVNDTFMSDALFVGIGDRIQWADPNDTQIFSGEILGFNGDNYDTSERFIPEPGVTYNVNITNSSGNVVGNTVVAIARSDTEYGFIASGLTGVYLSDSSNQLGSRYVIYAENQLTDLTLTRLDRPDNANNIAIEAIEYRSEVFAAD